MSMRSDKLESWQSHIFVDGLAWTTMLEGGCVIRRKPPNIFFLRDDDGSDCYYQDLLKDLDISHISVLYSGISWA